MSCRGRARADRAWLPERLCCRLAWREGPERLGCPVDAGSRRAATSRLGGQCQRHGEAPCPRRAAGSHVGPAIGGPDLRAPLQEAVALALRAPPAADASPDGKTGDVLKRHESNSYLLRRMRRVAAALEGLRRRLERPAWNLDALRWRLHGPVGPAVLARQLAAAEGRGGGVYACRGGGRTMRQADWSEVTRRLGAEAVDAEVAAGSRVLATMVDEVCADTPPALDAYVREHSPRSPDDLARHTRPLAHRSTHPRAHRRRRCRSADGDRAGDSRTPADAAWGAVLADEVGMGKTFVALAVAAQAVG